MRAPRPDPYNGFKNDDQRRRALNTRVISQAVCTVSIALALVAQHAPNAAILWLKTFIH